MKIQLQTKEEVAEREERETTRGAGLGAKYWVRLTEEERRELEGVTHTGRSAARTVQHAWILLKADASEDGPGWCDEEISKTFHVSTQTVARVRRTFVEEGLRAALHRKRAERAHLRKIDGELEARLIALQCSDPPEGEARWTLRLLADQAVELEYVGEISHEAVRQVLKKTNSSRGSRSSGSFRRRQVARLSGAWKTC